MMLGMRVTVRTYDPQWPRDFERIKLDLEAALRGVNLLRIEHVGSTSVPGLAAKPILDIDVVVPVEAVPLVVALLTAIGYQDERARDTWSARPSVTGRWIGLPCLCVCRWMSCLGKPPRRARRASR